MSASPAVTFALGLLTAHVPAIPRKKPFIIIQLHGTRFRSLGAELFYNRKVRFWIEGGPKIKGVSISRLPASIFHRAIIKGAEIDLNQAFVGVSVSRRDYNILMGTIARHNNLIVPAVIIFDEEGISL